MVRQGWKTLPESAIERRTRAFYEWEIRGRGWLLYPYPVSLEPPFVPFQGETTPPCSGRDDARTHTFASRFVENLLGPKHKETPESAPAEHPPAAMSAVRDALIEYDVLVPQAGKIDIALAREWVRSIASLRGPTSFEMIGHGATTMLRISVDERDAPFVRQHTKAFFPDVSLRPARTALEEMWGETDGAIVGAIEFGLAREFMLPLNEPSAKVSLLTPLLAAMALLDNGDIAVFQVLSSETTAPWAANAIRSVTTPTGDPFFADAPDVTALASEKFAQPIFATAIRAILCTDKQETAEDVLLALSTALGSCGSATRNELTPLRSIDIDTVIENVLNRTSNRTGALLSLSELSVFVALPGDSVHAERLVRRNMRTKAAPVAARGRQFALGLNEHEGEQNPVGLTTHERLKHCHVIGASGTGKSTLLLSLMAQDIQAGNGFALLDPHGDLVDDVLALIPPDRIQDVILFDPADEKYPVAFNVLSAQSDLERTLLASDLVAAFRRLSTSFGDQMETVLANAILAVLESTQGGTLIDLRQLLLDPKFRSQFLTTVKDPDIVRYWEREFPLLKGTPAAPILTRLNQFLRPKLIRQMVSQKGDGLSFRSAMDSRHIFLARLSHGAIGEENSHLLGSLLVAKFAQTAMSRQNEPEESRTPFFMYVDEFHHFATPSLATILTGARKYALGLTLAHQGLRQLRSQSEDVASAALGNAHTRIVFRVAEEDAKTLAAGFSHFESQDLQNLGVGQAVARIERPDHDFNLEVVRAAAVSGAEAAMRREAIVAASRARYASPPAVIDQDITHAAETENAPAESPPARRSRNGDKSAGPDDAPEHPEARLPGRGGPRHKYLQSLVKRLAEDRGFDVVLEKRVLDGHGHVDVALTRDDRSIACEICITTSVVHEIGNLTKCLAAGFDMAVLICSEDRALQAVRALSVDDLSGRVRMITPENIIAFLDELAATREPGASSERPREESPSARGASAVKTTASSAALSEKKRLIISRDAALYIGLAPQTLAKLRVTGGSPPYFKVGRQVVYDRADLDSWLSVRRRRSTSDKATTRGTQTSESK